MLPSFFLQSNILRDEKHFSMRFCKVHLLIHVDVQILCVKLLITTDEKMQNIGTYKYFYE